MLFAILAPAFAAETPERLTSNPANEGRADLSGNVIVWKGNQNGNFDIYMYNTVTRMTQVVTDNPAIQNLPITNGSVVVWQDYRSGNNDIYYRNVLFGIEQPLVVKPGNQGIGAINGNTVVYVDDSAGNNDIYAIDLISGEITPVCVNTANQWEPRISGSRVVWEDNRDGNWNIYMKDLSTGVEEAVSTDPGDDRVSDISGNLVVWQAHHNGQYDIWMKDLASGIQQAVAADGGYKTSPRISGDLVIWQDFRNDANPSDAYYDYDIYARDLTAGTESIVAGGISIQAEPAIDHETVVWSDTIGGSYDIWMRKIPDVTSPVISNLAPADGSATGCSSPFIHADFADNRTGVDEESVILTLDGQDVTDEAVVTGESISYQPDSMADGQHTVSLSLADGAGNSSSRQWQFDTARPVLKMSSQQVFWASYDEYLVRQLSVRYLISNSSAADALSLQILASNSTAGVIMTDSMPLEMGEIQPGSNKSVVVRYLVPPGVAGFKTTVYSSCLDASGSTFYFPGPPPV